MDLRRFFRHARYAMRALWHAAFPSAPIQLPEPTEPSHPLQHCRCGDVTFDRHAPGCRWRAVMCRTCEGNGWCPRCMGDGIDPESEVAHG